MSVAEPDVPAAGGVCPPVLSNPAAPARRERGRPLPESRAGEPTWEIAERMYPPQGAWTDAEYDRLAEGCPVPVVFDGGTVRFLADARRESTPGEPTWEVAEFCHPRQGDWTEEDYFAVGDACAGTVEFADGTLEFQALPDFVHADLGAFLYDLFRDHCRLHDAGLTRFATLTVRGLPENRNREPDVLVLRPGTRRGRRYPTPRDVLEHPDGRLFVLCERSARDQRCGRAGEVDPGHDADADRRPADRADHAAGGSRVRRLDGHHQRRRRRARRDRRAAGALRGDDGDLLYRSRLPRRTVGGIRRHPRPCRQLNVARGSGPVASVPIRFRSLRATPNPRPFA